MIKLLKVLFLTLLAFLLQTGLASVIAIGGVAPNLALAVFAVVSIALGRKYCFFMSLTVGYLMEITLAALNYMSFVLYPVAAMLGALLFSDKSERRLAEERSSEKGLRKAQINPHIRTVLAAIVSDLLFEFVHLVYIYLNGVQASFSNIGRALMAVAYTAIAAFILQFPLRALLGTYRMKKARV